MFGGRRENRSSDERPEEGGAKKKKERSVTNDYHVVLFEQKSRRQFSREAAAVLLKMDRSPGRLRAQESRAAASSGLTNHGVCDGHRDRVANGARAHGRPK